MLKMVIFQSYVGAHLPTPVFWDHQQLRALPFCKVNRNGWGFEGPEKLWLYIYMYISTYKEKMQPQFVFDVVFYPFLEVASLD